MISKTITANPAKNTTAKAAASRPGRSGGGSTRPASETTDSSVPGLSAS
jgi:hypothetical protein